MVLGNAPEYKKTFETSTGSTVAFWARSLHMPQANIDVRVVDGVFVKMGLFADVSLYTACQNGINIKMTRSGSKCRCGHLYED